MFPGLRARWSKRLKDIIFEYDQQKCDARLLNNVFTDQFTAELERRGYDVTTMKFSIKRKVESETTAD